MAKRKASSFSSVITMPQTTLTQTTNGITLKRPLESVTITMTAQPDLVAIQRQQKIRRREIALKEGRERYRLLTPEALQGRRHVDVQTELNLEVLNGDIEVTDIECETHAFPDRPASPLFIPAKSVKDAETQIEEGELFDFDREVRPVLDVLVGEIIEQSLKEAVEEEELASLKAQQRAFKELRNSELAEVQRLQQVERRLTVEKEKRIAQQREMLKVEREVAEKIAARAFTQEYLASLLPAAISSLRSDGNFFDPVQNDVETHFMPWLMVEVNNHVKKRIAAREVLDCITYDAAQMRLEAYKEKRSYRR